MSPIELSWTAKNCWEKSAIREGGRGAQRPIALSGNFCHHAAKCIYLSNMSWLSVKCTCLLGRYIPYDSNFEMVVRTCKQCKEEANVQVWQVIEECALNSVRLWFRVVQEMHNAHVPLVAYVAWTCTAHVTQYTHIWVRRPKISYAI